MGGFQIKVSVILYGSIFIIFVPNAGISRDFRPDDFSKMITVVSVGTSTQYNIPGTVSRDIIKGENSAVEVVIQPSSPNDIRAFNGFVTDKHGGQVVIF